MKYKLSSLILIGALAAAALPALGQTSNSPPTTPVTQSPPIPSAFEQATNQSTGTIVFNALLGVLPAWDATQTNDFQSGEFTIESAPLWKTTTAAGTTPYNSTEADWFFSRNFAVGGEIISLGSGTGSSSIDTLNLSLTLRKDVGNIAGYLLADLGYGFNFAETLKNGQIQAEGRFEGAFGPGVIYQYQTHIRLFVDTRFELAGQKNSQEGFLTRIGMQIPF